MTTSDNPSPEPVVAGESVETAALKLAKEWERIGQELYAQTQQYNWNGESIIARGVRGRTLLMCAVQLAQSLSGGTTNETGKATEQAQVTGPQSNRQHAGEGEAKTEAEEALIEECLRRLTTCEPSIPHRLTHAVAAERAPLVGREREKK